MEHYRSGEPLTQELCSERRVSVKAASIGESGEYRWKRQYSHERSPMPSGSGCPLALLDGERDGVALAEVLAALPGLALRVMVGVAVAASGGAGDAIGADGGAAKPGGGGGSGGRYAA